EGQPGQRDPVTQEERRQHPLQVRGSQPAIAVVFEEVLLVIPIRESVSKRGKKGQEDERHNQRRQQEARLEERQRLGMLWHGLKRIAWTGRIRPYETLRRFPERRAGIITDADA